MEIRRIVPNLACADLATTRAFYEGLLGLRVAMDLGWIATLASTANPSAQLSLGEGEAEGGPHLTVEVDDVDATYAAARGRGADVVYPLTEEDWGVRRFFVRDPDGRVVNVMTHVGGRAG